MSSAQSKNTRQSLAKSLIAGTHKHFPNGSQELAFGGATRTVSALAQLLQSYVDLRDAVTTFRAAARARVAAERAQSQALLAVIDEYVAFVRATFGKQPDVLSDFGLAPPKARAPQSAEKKAVATAKRAATRAVRHTMGAKQKKGVKGNVSATLVVSADGASKGAPPAAPPPAPTPAKPVS
jgi:hypothetical protein